MHQIQTQSNFRQTMIDQTLIEQKYFSNKDLQQLKNDILKIVESLHLLHHISPQVISQFVIVALKNELFQRFLDHQNELNALFDEAQKHLFEKSAEQSKKVGKIICINMEPSINLHGKIQAEQQKKSIIAKSFCQRGSTYSALKKEISLNIYPLHINVEEFQHLLNKIIEQSYTQLEQYLLKYCQIQMKPLDYNLYKNMRTFLINCRKNLESANCITLFNIIQGQYSLIQVKPIKQKDAFCLLQSILLYLGQPLPSPILKDKKEVYQHTSPPQIEALVQIWNSDIEIKFIELFQRQTSLRTIGIMLGKIYPHYSPLFNDRTLKAILCKILRVSIRKLQHFIHNKQQYQLTDLPDAKVKCILNRTNSLSIRRLLLKLHQADDYHQFFMRKLIESINKYFNQNHNQSQSTVVSNVATSQILTVEQQYLAWVQIYLKFQTNEQQSDILLNIESLTTYSSKQIQSSFATRVLQQKIGKEDIDQWLEEKYR